MKKIHFVELARNEKTACGRRLIFNTSHIPQQVTCGQCKRAKTFNERAK